MGQLEIQNIDLHHISLRKPKKSICFFTVNIKKRNEKIIVCKNEDCLLQDNNSKHHVHCCFRVYIHYSIYFLSMDI